MTVDALKMHKVDPRNAESLFGMWTGKSLHRSTSTVGIWADPFPHSLLQVRRFLGGRQEIREPELEALDSRDAVLRTSTTIHPFTRTVDIATETEFERHS